MGDEKVYEIDVNKKYVMILPHSLTAAERDHIHDMVNQFMRSPNQRVLFIPDTIRLVKVSDDYPQEGQIQ